MPKKTETKEVEAGTALVIKMKGDIVESNFPTYKKEILAMIKGIKLTLETDEDFAEAKETAKKCKAAEVAITEAKEDALNQTKPIREIFAAMDEVKGTMAETRLTLDKLVKNEEARKKKEAVDQAEKELRGLIEESDALTVSKTTFKVDRTALENSTKAKRTIESVNAALTKEVARQVAEFEKLDNLAANNAEILAPYLAANPSLFVDENRLLVMSSEAMVEIITSRVAKFKADEETRIARAAAAEEKERADKAEVKLETPAPGVTHKAEDADTADGGVSYPPSPAEKATAGAKEDAGAPIGGFLIQVLIAATCDDARVVKIGQTLKNTMAAYGDDVEKIRITRR